MFRRKSARDQPLVAGIADELRQVPTIGAESVGPGIRAEIGPLTLLEGTRIDEKRKMGIAPDRWFRPRARK